MPVVGILPIIENSLIISQGETLLGTNDRAGAC
jgi:hypothetical protein